MRNYAEIEYSDLEKNEEYEILINKVLEECFITEKLDRTKLYISITLTTPENIREYNSKYRGIDKETDVLSFPMFEKEEINGLMDYEYEEPIGDIIISIEKVKEQSLEYGHSFERELAYMVVHGFYHLMGEDHIEENDKIKMREKEEKILNKLSIVRE